MIKAGCPRQALATWHVSLWPGLALARILFRSISRHPCDTPARERSSASGAIDRASLGPGQVGTLPTLSHLPPTSTPAHTPVLPHYNTTSRRNDINVYPIARAYFKSDTLPRLELLRVLMCSQMPGAGSANAAGVCARCLVLATVYVQSRACHPLQIALHTTVRQCC